MKNTATICTDARPIPEEYEMFSKAGNARVKTMVNAALNLPMSTSNADLYAFLRERMNKIAERYGEVWDTAVRDAFISTIERRTGRELSVYEL